MTDAQWRPGGSINWERPGYLFTSGGLHAFVLQTIGAKSGDLRRAVLGYLEEGSDAWLIIGSKSGADENPGWVHNLAKDPEATVVLADGERVAVRAEALGGEQLEQAWTRIAIDAPEYVKYRSSTARAIPVIRLQRR